MQVYKRFLDKKYREICIIRFVISHIIVEEKTNDEWSKSIERWEDRRVSNDERIEEWCRTWCDKIDRIKCTGDHRDAGIADDTLR
jgi:hypothetical protein